MPQGSIISLNVKFCYRIQRFWKKACPERSEGSQNQYYNKRVAKLKTGKAQDYWDSELAAITEKRNRQMRDNINKAARFIINWCIKNNIGLAE